MSCIRRGGCRRCRRGGALPLRRQGERGLCGRGARGPGAVATAVAGSTWPRESVRARPSGQTEWRAARVLRPSINVTATREEAYDFLLALTQDDELRSALAADPRGVWRRRDLDRGRSATNHARLASKGQMKELLYRLGDDEDDKFGNPEGDAWLSTCSPTASCTGRCRSSSGAEPDGAPTANALSRLHLSGRKPPGLPALLRGTAKRAPFRRTYAISVLRGKAFAVTADESLPPPVAAVGPVGRQRQRRRRRGGALRAARAGGHRRRRRGAGRARFSAITRSRRGNGISTAPWPTSRPSGVTSIFEHIGDPDVDELPAAVYDAIDAFVAKHGPTPRPSTRSSTRARCMSCPSSSATASSTTCSPGKTTRRFDPSA